MASGRDWREVGPPCYPSRVRRMKREHPGPDPDAPAPLPCPHYPDCVSCGLVGAPYGEQLARKRQVVSDELARYPRFGDLEVPAVVGSPRIFGYRNQAKLVVRRTARRLLLGVYRPGTHQVVDISSCATHHPLLNEVLSSLRTVIEKHDVPAYDEGTGSGWLRYLVVRVSGWTRSAQVIPVIRARDFPGERPFIEALRRIRRVRSVVLNLNPSPGNVIFGRTFIPMTRELSLIERVGGLQLKSRAGAFLQANIAVARRVYECVLRWAEPGPQDTAVDLYCGIGAISFCLAGEAGRVWGIEESPISVLDAKENIRLNGYHNVRFVAGDVAAQLPEVAARAGGRVDLITLNPPRKGADEPTRSAIVACAPARVVYVSCDPRTLARDLNWFGERGYVVARLQPFDMLPQTDHVEVVARLDRQS